MDVKITEALVRLHESRELAVGWDDHARDAMCWLEDLCRDGDTGRQHAAEIAAADGIFCLTTMLPELPKELAASAHVILASITALPDCRDKFAEASAYIDICVDTMEKGKLQDANVQMAASAIANLCAEECGVSDMIVEAGAVPALVSLLRRWTGAPKIARMKAVRTMQWVAAALCNLSQAGRDAVGALVSWDAVSAINAALSHRNDSSTEQLLCGCLSNIAAIDPRGLLDSGGIEVVLAILQGGRSSRGKRAAVQVISNLQHEHSFDINQELREAGVEAGLREIDRAKSPQMLRNSIESALDNLTLCEDDSAMLSHSIKSSPEMKSLDHSRDSRQDPTSRRRVDGFSAEKAASLLLSKNWSRRSVEALLQRPEKLRAVMATLCGRPASSTPQHLTGAPGQHMANAHHHSPQTFANGVARGRSASHTGSESRYDNSTLVQGANARPNTAGGYAYMPGRLPPRAATAMAQFGRSTNVAALPLWGVDVLNLFLPTGLAPRAVIYRCFGEAFARAEDLVDVVMLERYSVAVLTFRYLDEKTCKQAHAALQDDGRLQRTTNGWPLRLVKEGVLIKTYVKSIAGDSEVSIIQEIFTGCSGAPMYEECEVLRDTSSISTAQDSDEQLVDDEFAAAEFEAGHLRCFYRNQTDLSEFAYACASAGFSTRDLGVVQRHSEWDGQTRSPSRCQGNVSLPNLY